jgi:predicted dinucleotide-binding enzyme
MTDVVVLVGAGQIGQAIARRVDVGKHVLLADMRADNANAAAEVLGNAGYEASVATVRSARASSSPRLPMTNSTARVAPGTGA